MTRRRWWVVGIAVVAVLAAIGGYAWLGPGRYSGGRTTPELALSAYAGALRSEDGRTIRRLINPSLADHREQAAEIMATYGGRLDLTSWTLEPSASSEFEGATVTGTLDGRPFSGSIGVSRLHQRWFITPIRPK